MRCRNAKHRLTVQRDSNLARPAENDLVEPLHDCVPCREYNRRQEQPDQLLVTPPSRMYPSISTERIMRAVEQQRRITQQLEHLRAIQKQRTALLRTAGLKFLAGALLTIGILIIVLVVLSISQPDVLVRMLILLSDVIATLFAVTEGIKTELSLIPSNSWLLSVAALAVVLMMGLWLRLMRHPQEA